MAEIPDELMNSIAKMAVEQSTTVIAEQAYVFAKFLRDEEESGHAMPASVALKAFADTILVTNNKVWPTEGKPS